MLEFRDRIGEEHRLIIHSNRSAIDANTNPFDLGTGKCCGLLKTRALLDALTENRIDAAIGGARREEERRRMHVCEAVERPDVEQEHECQRDGQGGSPRQPRKAPRDSTDP